MCKMWPTLARASNEAQPFELDVTSAEAAHQTPSGGRAAVAMQCRRTSRVDPYEEADSHCNVVRAGLWRGAGRCFRKRGSGDVLSGGLVFGSSSDEHRQTVRAVPSR